MGLGKVKQSILRKKRKRIIAPRIWFDRSRYSAAELPAIRRERGVGRPPAVLAKRRAAP